MRHFKITFKPEGRQVSVHEGASLLEAAGLAGIIVNTPCGGRGTCGKCVAIIAPAGTKVLACKYIIHSDLVVTVPVGSRFYKHKILAEGKKTAGRFQPDIYKKYKNVETCSEIFGLAVDIGTTTVVVKLIDLTTGQTIDTQAIMNPQIQLGDDVISRINYAQTEKGLADLRQAIVDCINNLISELCRKNSLKIDCIYETAIVGNTTMNHIFLGFPVTSLGQTPYKAYCVEAKNITPQQAGLNMNPDGNVYMAPNIAGFVGSDTTSVAVAVGMNFIEQVTLAVDIGTNGEILLSVGDEIYAVSCAAGPAFEGARISQGSRAADGAIEAVIINDDGDIDLDVIGDCPPCSICGSGLIDAVAVLLDLGVIESTGRFAEIEKLKDTLPSVIVDRLDQKDGQPAFILAHNKNVSEEPVLLTQKDIRETQLAKAAIRAGIKFLQKQKGISDKDIESVLLAGAFGNYIRKESAMRIGLLPNVPLEKIHFVGNAAGSGAEMLLISESARKLADNLAEKIEYIEIASEADFQTVYTDCLIF